MTTEELERRIKVEGLHVSIRGYVDAFVLCRTLDISRRTLGYWIEEGRAPPYKILTRKMWFPTDELADWITRNYE